MIHYVGEIIVDDHEICKVIDVDNNGIYTAETIIPKSAFIEAFEKYIYNPTVITCNPLSDEKTEKSIKSFQSARIVPDNLQGWRYEETPQGEGAERALSIIDRLYTEGHINNMEQGVLRRAVQND